VCLAETPPGDDRTDCLHQSKRISVRGVTLAIVPLVPRTGPPWQIAFHRFAEVSTGIGVALVFAIVWPEREALPAPQKLHVFQVLTIGR
jgi:hypothetical protein